jgi:hypothetical protein
VETIGGNPGNGMNISYVRPGTWQGNSWKKPVVLGEYNSVQFDVRTIAGSVSGLLFTIDEKNNRVPVSPGSAWSTVLVPLSSIYGPLPLSITTFDFIDNSNSNYTIIVDNIKLVNVPTNTVTLTKTVTMTKTVTPTSTVSPTITQTGTITRTWTASQTYTITMTPTQTSTPSPKFVEVSQWLSFPNPTDGKKITFRCDIHGFADKLVINVYTFGERKIYSAAEANVAQGIYTKEWVPSMKLASGLYYYTIEATNGNKSTSRHVSAFFVHRDISTP